MSTKKQFIQLNPAEIQSGVHRVRHAEGLIEQLPANHDGRCTWLLNYGIREEAVNRRTVRHLEWIEHTEAAKTIGTTSFPMLDPDTLVKKLNEANARIKRFEESLMDAEKEAFEWAHKCGEAKGELLNVKDDLKRANTRIIVLKNTIANQKFSLWLCAVIFAVSSVMLLRMI